MDFAALPPEINSARMYAGPGAGPMLAAAAAWDSLAAELASAAAAYQSEIAELAEQWRGPSSVTMSTAAAPYVRWMDSTAAQAGQTAAQAKAAAAAYETAFAMTVPPPVITANRAQLAMLVATNLLGQNTPAIAANEAHYGQMWAQDAAAMYGYAGSAAAATRLTPFTAPKQNTDPGATGGQTASVAQAAGTRAQSAASRLTATVTQALQGLSQPPPSGFEQSVMNGAVAASGKGVAVGAENAGAAGLALDELGLAVDAVGLAGMEAPGLGTEFAGLGIEFGGLGIELVPQGLGALGGLALVGDLAPVAGLGGAGLVSGPVPMGDAGLVGTAGAAWANMGQAASLGSLSVPQAWAAAAPQAIRQFALVSAQSGAASAATAMSVTGAAEIPYPELALAGMAGRAMAGATGRGLREFTGAMTRQRLITPKESPDDGLAANGPLIGLVAELRGLAELRDCGILTEEEFSQQKQRLLGNQLRG